MFHGHGPERFSPEAIKADVDRVRERSRHLHEGNTVADDVLFLLGWVVRLGRRISRKLFRLSVGLFR